MLWLSFCTFSSRVCSCGVLGILYKSHLTWTFLNYYALLCVSVLVIVINVLPDQSNVSVAVHRPSQHFIVWPHQNASKDVSPFTHSHIPTDNFTVTYLPFMYVFRLWEEAREPRQDLFARRQQHLPRFVLCFVFSQK